MPPDKKAVNLSVDAALLREACDRDINLSATLERALVDVLRQVRRATAQLAGICAKELGAPIADLTPDRQTISAALDLLFTGI